MSMEKPVAALEVTTKSIKILIGYEIEGKVYAIYSDVKKIGNIKKMGVFTDINNTISSAENYKLIIDESAKLKINISEALVALPPVEFQVFQTNQVTTVVSEVGRVDSIDIRNIYTLIKKNRIGYPASSTIVDIIPERYILDQGRTYTKMPLGETTNTLNLIAKVHVLPRSIVDEHDRILTENNINIKRNIVAPYAACELLGTYPEVPNDYILVDIGANETIISLVGLKQLFASSIIPFGGDDITHKIEETFNISEDEAEKIKCAYGLKNRKMNFEAPVAEFMDENGNTRQFLENELSQLIKGELDRFVAMLNNEINNLLKNENPAYKNLPMILIGGGALLKGLEEYLEPKVQSKSVKVVIPKTFGCRNPSFVNLLGMIYVQGKEHVSLDKNLPQVGEVKRVKE